MSIKSPSDGIKALLSHIVLKFKQINTVEQIILYPGSFLVGKGRSLNKTTKKLRAGVWFLNLSTGFNRPFYKTVASTSRERKRAFLNGDKDLILNLNHTHSFQILILNSSLYSTNHFLLCNRHFYSSP